MKPGLLVLSPSADMYGSDQVLLDGLPTLLERARVTVLVASPGPFVDAARSLGAEVIETVDFAARRRFLHPTALPASLRRSLTLLRQVRSLVHERSIDLVLVNTVAVPTIPLLRFVGRRPVVVHVHERALGGRLESAMIRMGVQVGATAVIANSEFTATTLSDRTRSRTTVIHNGVAATDSRRLDSDDSTMRVICVGRLHPKKGQAVLVEAVADLVDAGIDISLDLLGDALPEHGEVEENLRETVARRGLTDRVELHGYVDDPDAHYRSNDVVVVSSVAPEEFSLVAAEGQMRGLAAVVTGPGGVSEVVADGETGLVVPAGDRDALASALRALAVDPELRRRMGEAGHRRMTGAFTVERYRSRLGEFIDEELEIVLDRMD